MLDSVSKHLPVCGQADGPVDGGPKGGVIGGWQNKDGGA